MFLPCGAIEPPRVRHKTCVYALRPQISTVVCTESLNAGVDPMQARRAEGVDLLGIVSMVTPLCFSCEIISRAAAASRGRFERVEALQHPHHLRCGPHAYTSRGWDALCVESFCDGAQARFPGRL